MLVVRRNYLRGDAFEIRLLYQRMEVGKVSILFYSGDKAFTAKDVEKTRRGLQGADSNRNALLIHVMNVEEIEDGRGIPRISTRRNLVSRIGLVYLLKAQFGTAEYIVSGRGM